MRERKAARNAAPPKAEHARNGRKELGEIKVGVGGIFVSAIILIVVAMALFLSISNARTGSIKGRLIDSKFGGEHYISPWDYSFIGLNFDNQSIGLGKDASLAISNFSQIIKVDLLRNDQTTTSTDRGSLLTRAVVGGVLLGGVGAVVGAVTAKTHSTSELSKISLRVITESGSYTILFLNLGNTSSAGHSSAISSASSEADRFYGLVLKAMKQAAAPQPAATANRQPILPSMSSRAAAVSSVSVASEIEKLWKLKENGAISDQEYERAKQTLLSQGRQQLIQHIAKRSAATDN